MPKPADVCWCDCHMPLDENGRREFRPDPWPKYSDPVATAIACVNCQRDHAEGRFIPVREGGR